MNPFEIVNIWRPQTAGAFLRRFVRGREGIIAVEFALIAPLLVTTYFGVTELSDGFTAKGKVTVVASTAADLTAQETSVCNAEIADIYAALGTIMFPYASNNMKVRITSLIDSNGAVKIGWSDALNDTPRSSVPGDIPAGVLVSGSGGSVILAEVTYNYSSPAGHLIYGSIPLSDKFYLRPRRTSQIARTTNC